MELCERVKMKVDIKLGLEKWSFFYYGVGNREEQEGISFIGLGSFGENEGRQRSFLDIKNVFSDFVCFF